MVADGTPSPITMMLVQDDPADALYARDSLELNKVDNPLHVVRNVAEALTFLRRDPPYQDTPRPDVLLLDLSLPRVDGRVLLRHLSSSPLLAEVPVFVLVDSPAAERILRAENLPVRGYLRKPVDFATVQELVRTVASFGFTVLRHG